MFIRIRIIPVLLAATIINTASFSAAKPESLKVLAYKSLVGEGTWGEWLAAEFRRRTGAAIEWQSFGSTGEALTQVSLVQGQCPADVIFGVDNSFLARAVSLQRFAPWKKNLAAEVKRELLDSLGKAEPLFLPFDYGYLAILHRSPKIRAGEFASLEDFAATKGYDKKLIVLDPRSSSVGLSFLLWSQFGTTRGATATWKTLQPKILTVATGWSTGYGVFLKGGADFVVSYSTSPAYHIEKENREDIKSMQFRNGHFRQVEGALLLGCSTQTKLAEGFAELMLSEAAQSALPRLQWMYPARRGIVLPTSFQKLGPEPRGIVPPATYDEATRLQLVDDWEKSFATAK